MKKAKIAWGITSGALAFILAAASITTMGFIPTVMDNLFGGATGSGRGDNMYYKLDDGIETKEQAKEHANDVNKQVCEEGFVLLKNENNTLPLKTTSAAKKKISVFGKNSVNLAYGGSGSGGGSTAEAKTIYESLAAANFDCNPTLKSFYEDNSKSGEGRPANLAIEAGIPTGFETGETAVSKYTDSVKSSFTEYGDMAVIVISRTGGEGNDMPMTQKNKDGSAVSGAYAADDHYLELDKNEQEMIKMVTESFNKVVLVVNSSAQLELGFLDTFEDYDDTVISKDFGEKIGAAIWIGGPGNSGIMALGEILNGDVNPSGKLVDTYIRDFTKDPTYVNFASTTDRSDKYTGSKNDYYFSDYDEGIYVGYRYYETRFATEGTNGDAWYKKNVVYPFGYGLSYTSFNWTVKDKPTKIEKGKDMTVKVHVDNAGAVAGKDVVELYVGAPYKGGIEKASKTLVGYAKTDLLEAGKGEDVEITFNPYDFASYDSSDANGNSFKGYELESGTYTFYVSTDAHTVVDSFTISLDSDIKYENDEKTGNKVENRFDDIDDQLGSVLSRSNWDGTWPKARTDAERALASADETAISSRAHNSPLNADSPEVKAANLELAKKKVTDGSLMQISELIGASYDDEKWDEYIKNITASSLQDMIEQAAFGTHAIEYVGKPKTIETDGPSGFAQFMSTAPEPEIYSVSRFASEPVVGATFNDELIEKLGEAIGNEGILGNQRDGTPYSALYAPGINLHRSPFAGRTAEYYSEDPVLNGNMAASFIKGMRVKGVNCYMKHFVANEAETHRSGVCTWMTEQVLRELYLKPFEIAVKKNSGEPLGLMSSFNRLGNRWTGGDYRLITEVLREEWGFKGAVITDFADSKFMPIEQMIYAGGDIYLNNVPVETWFDKTDTMDVFVLKKAAKNYLYTVVNSNAMNGLGEGIVYKTNMAKWKVALIAVDASVGGLIVLSGAAIFLVDFLKKKKA